MCRKNPELHIQRSKPPICDNVATKIDALLARVAGVKRGDECQRPTRFNTAGERHANQVAARDAAVHCGHERTTPTPPIFTPSTESHS